MKSSKSYHLTIAITTITLLSVLPPSTAHGQDMNLSGTLNVNDYQSTTTSNLLLSMLVTLAESIIPIVVGAVVGHKSITHWQEKKDRIARKNRILDNYSQSVKMHGILLGNFVQKVFKSYIIFRNPETDQSAAVAEFTSTKDNVGGFLEFPSNPSELPCKKFASDYEDLLSRIDGLSQSLDRLYIDLGALQSRGKESIGRLQTIRDLQKRSELVAAKFLQSATRDEFILVHKQFRSLCDSIKEETDAFETELCRLRAG